MIRYFKSEKKGIEKYTIGSCKFYFDRVTIKLVTRKPM